MLAAVAPPVVEQVERGAGHAKIFLVAPLLHAIADEIYQLEFLPGPARRVLIIRERRFRVAIEVTRRAASRALLRRGTFLDIPMLGRLVVWRVQYWLWYFVVAHSSASPSSSPSW